MLENNIRGFTGPMKYLQGYGVITRLEEYTRTYSKKVFILIDAYLYPTLGSRIAEVYRQSESECQIEKCAGECCPSEVARVRALVENGGCGIIAALGGGKTLDVAKATANELMLPFIMCPTAASNDAPAASLAVMYTDEGVRTGSLFLKRSAELVLIDTEIIAKAPVRLFKAGIGDALATIYEAEANDRTEHKNFVTQAGYRRTLTGLAIAKLSYEVLKRDATAALIALEAGAVTEAVENCIEANILMSGMGYQNTGCSVPHAVNAGFTELEEAASNLHGECVAFGVLVQFVFEGRGKEETDDLVRFMMAVGLPTTLAQLGVDYRRSDRIDQMTDMIVHRNGTIYSEAFFVDEVTVKAAILGADAIGRAYQEGKSLL